MFESLKSRLKEIRTRLGTDIDAAAASSAGDSGTVQEGPADLPLDAGQQTGIVDKVKALVKDRELIIGDGDVRNAIDELEIVLLENDVAFPVTEEILTHLRKQLVGRRRKIGESVDSIVLSALKTELTCPSRNTSSLPLPTKSPSLQLGLKRTL